MSELIFCSQTLSIVKKEEIYNVKCLIINWRGLKERGIVHSACRLFFGSFERKIYYFGFLQALHSEGDDFGVFFKKPLFNDRVAECLGMAGCYQAKFGKLIQNFHHDVLRLVRHDIVFHIFIGKTFVAFLLGILLDVAGDNTVFGKISVALLQLAILLGSYNR